MKKLLSVQLFFLVSLIHSLSYCSAQAVVDDSTIPFISSQLSEFFSQLGLPLDAIVSAAAILLGLILAIFGARGQGVKLLAFVSGALVGCFAGAVILLSVEASSAKNGGTQTDISNSVWVGIFFASGLVVALLMVCLTMFAKIVMGIASGLAIAAFLLQLGLGSLIGNNIAILVIVIVACIVGIIVAWKLVDLIYAILAAVLGGLLITFGIGFFTKSDLTINKVTTDPSSVLACKDPSCLIPLIIGGIVILISLIYNIYGFSRSRRERKNKEQTSGDNAALVNEMQTERQQFESRFNDLERRNQQVILDMERQAANRENTYAQDLTKKMISKDVEHSKQLQAIEMQMIAQQKEQLKRDKKKDEDHAKQLKSIEKQLQTHSAKQGKDMDRATMLMVETLEMEKRDLQEQIRREREVVREKEMQLNKRQADFAAGLVSDMPEALLTDEEKQAGKVNLASEDSIPAPVATTIVTKKERASIADDRRRDMLIELETEVADGRARVQEYEKQVKEAARLEKRLNIRVPKDGLLANDKFDILDSTKEAKAIEEINQMKQRAEEFAKYQQLVARTKSGQKDALKYVKNALKQVEKASAQIQILSRKAVKAQGEDLEDIQRQQELGLEEATVKLALLRTFLEKYEAISKSFNELVAELEAKLDEFKAAEAALEARGQLNAETVDMLSAESALHIQENETLVVVAGDQLSPERRRQIALSMPGDEATEIEVDFGKKVPPPPTIYPSEYFKTNPEDVRPKGPTSLELNTALYLHLKAKWNNFRERFRGGSSPSPGHRVSPSVEYEVEPIRRDVRLASDVDVALCSLSSFSGQTSNN